MEVQQSIEMKSLGGSTYDNDECSVLPQSTELKPLPIWKLFRSATCLDIVLIIFASFLSAVAGLCMPAVIFIIGYVITEFSNFSIAELINSFSSNNLTVIGFCDNTTTFTGYLDYLNSANPDSRLRTQLYFYACILLGAALGYLISLGISSFLWSIVAFRRERLMKKKLVECALRQDQSYYDIHHNGTEITDLLIEHVKNASSIVTQSCGEIIEQLSSAIGSLVVALVVNWALALAVGSMTVALLIMLGIFGKLGLYGIHQVQSRLNIAASCAEQILLSIKTVMAYGGKEKEAKRYKTLLSHTWIYSIMKSISSSIIFSFYVLIIFGAFSLGFWYGTELYIMCTGITVGDIVLVIVLMSQLNNSIGYTIVPLDNLNKASISGAYLFNFIDEDPTIIVEGDSNKLTLNSITGEIRITDVVFSYPARPSATILQNVNLHIVPGQTVALVGPSGCGKSTLLSLITRVYDVTKGSILLDGHNVKDFSVRWLKDQIGIVSQQPILFNVSIAENIRYGKETATVEEIQTAAELANIHDFIVQLPDGYETLVGEGGSLISGGQKQRIAIARALVKNPKLLLLDEPTSALDVKSERLVEQALDRAREGRTTIIIAHRLSTIKNADVIVAMDKGHVIEMGTHSELMENEGLYYKLVRTKSSQEEGNNEQSKGFRKALNKSGKSRKRSTLRRSTSLYDRTQRSNTARRSSDPGGRRSSNALRPLSIQPMEMLSLEEIDGGTLRKPKYANLLLLLKPDWGILTLGIIFYSLSGVQQSSVYILMTQALDVYTQADSTAITNDVQLYVYLFVGIGVFGGILYFLGTLALDIGAHRASIRIRIELFESLLNQDASFFDLEENTVSTLLTHLTEGPEYIAEVCGIPIGFVVRIIFVGLSSVIVSFYASWALSLVLLPSFIIIIGSWWLDNLIGDIFVEKISEFLEDSNNTAVEAIEHVEAVNALGIGDKIAIKFINTFSESKRYVLYRSAIHACFYAIAKTSVIFVTSAAIAISGIIFLLDSSNKTHASFNNIILAVVSVLFTGVILKDAFTSLVHLQNAKVAGSEIYARLKWPRNTNSNGGQVLKPFTADISANSVYFSYPSASAPSILNSLTFTVKEGQSIAFVGPSGSGKSTIISLIEKFYSNFNSGTLNIGGKDIGVLDTTWLREQIGLVSQEPVLFDISIADNIRYGANHREVTDEEIHEAAKSANIHEFIMSLSEGYNTLVGLRGTQISGGQKQRIAIARALIRNPKILLLDEATSALDAESERHVQEALDQARQGRTTIIIAHRLSTIQNADCIAVLLKGRIIEQGTHAELMGMRGAYFRMMNEQ